MPNWCSTTYKCVGNERELKSLYEILQKIEARKKPVNENDFGRLWLGELVTELGYDWEKYRCRGEIIGFELEDEVLTIWQETAWCEQEGVRQAIEQKYPGIKVYWCDEEPGCDNYTTNDSEGLYFPDRYYLDTYDDPQYFETINELADFVSDLIGHKVEADFGAIQKALDEYEEIRQENDEDVFYSLHEFSVIE